MTLRDLLDGVVAVEVSRDLVGQRGHFAEQARDLLGSKRVADLGELEGEVADTPGAALIQSNMLARRVGTAFKSSALNRVPKPGSRASSREPAPVMTRDSATPASRSSIFLSIVAPPPISTSSSWKGLNPRKSMSIVYRPGGSTGNRRCPVSFVVSVSGPPISAGESTRTCAPAIAAPVHR